EPFAREMGIKLRELREGYALVEMRVREEHENIFGYAHGGATFALIDAAFELAGNSRGRVSVALNMNVTYTSPVRRGDVLRAEAREINTTRRTGLYEIKVRNQDDKLVASCSALVYRTDRKLVE
ncbi:PaaI family thioesterase, partial [Candidatus Pyrohabitans sp.]